MAGGFRLTWTGLVMWCFQHDDSMASRVGHEQLVVCVDVDKRAFVATRLSVCAICGLRCCSRPFTLQRRTDRLYVWVCVSVCLCVCVCAVTVCADQAARPSGSRGRREKIELDKQRSAEERAEERRWMDSVLAREARQLQQERDLQERQRLELKRWLEALQNSSRAEELVCPQPCRPLRFARPCCASCALNSVCMQLRGCVGRADGYVHGQREGCVCVQLWVRNTAPATQGGCH